MQPLARSFECVIESHRETLSIRPMGELDLESSPGFSRKAAEALGAGFEVVVLDLTDLEFCDSNGLRAIVELSEAASRVARYEITPGPASVQRIFEITGVEHRLPFASAV